MLTFRRKYYPSDNGGYQLFQFADPRLKERISWLNNLHTWLIIPILGIVIPNITGLFHASLFSFNEILINYGLFIAIALIIYKGNIFFLQSIKIRFDGSNMPYRKIVGLYFMVNIVYSGVIALSTLSAWNQFLNHGHPFSRAVVITTLVILIAVLFINNIYEIFYLQLEKEYSEEKMELLEAAKLKAELEVLTSQIDPHFMYNALTSLSFLLQQRPQEADKYNAMLAAQYKYVLKNKSCHFVRLSQEIHFSQQYFGIQQVRFGDSVILQVLGMQGDLHALKVPPLSVQTLVENALKHNSFSDERPLLIQVIISDNEVKVINNIQPLTYKTQTSGIGLNNLNQRVMLLAKQPITIEKTDDQYTVSLPVCK